MVANFIATLMNLAISCIFVMTMYQIAISIRMIAGQMDEVVAKFRKKLVYSMTFGVFFVFSTTLLLTLLLTRPDLQVQDKDTCYYVCIAIYVILFLFYLAALIRLSTAMRHLI